jgi:hypothetical protein
MERSASLTAMGVIDMSPPSGFSVVLTTTTWLNATTVEVTALRGVKLTIRNVPLPVGPPFAAARMASPVVVTTPVVLSIELAPGWGMTAVVPPFSIAQLE